MSGEGLSSDFSQPIDIDNDLLQEVVKIKADAIMARREEVLAAFVAKYGFEPERFCLIVEHTPTGTKERVLRLTDEEIEKARAAHLLTPMWEPISTAPYGEPILCIGNPSWDYPYLAIMVGHPANREFRLYDPFAEMTSTTQTHVDPSHWMRRPLPPPNQDTPYDAAP